MKDLFENVDISSLRGIKDYKCKPDQYHRKLSVRIIRKENYLKIIPDDVHLSFKKTLKKRPHKKM